MTDRMTLAHALEEGGMARGAAEHIATEIYDAIHDNVATKSDIESLRAATQSDIAAVRSDIEALRVSTKGEIESLRVATKSDIAGVRADMRTLLTSLELRLTLRFGGIAVAAGGILFAALHYWPPHA